MNKVTYIKHNNYRKDEYNIVSTIEIDSEGKKYVVKTAKNNKGVVFLNSFYDKYKYLCEIYDNTNLVILKPKKISKVKLLFEYLEYENFEKILIEDIKNDNFPGIEKKLEKFYTLIFSAKLTNTRYKNLEKFSQYFGNLLNNNSKGAPLIDINFDNFLFNNGKFYLVDFEWTFNANFDPNFLKNRAIFYFLKRNQNTLDTSPIIARLGISYTKIHEILKFESQFIENLTAQGGQQIGRLQEDLENIFDKTSPPNLISDINNLKIINSKIVHQLESLNSQLATIQNSLVWKLTKPLRSLPFKRSR